MRVEVVTNRVLVACRSQGASMQRASLHGCQLVAIVKGLGLCCDHDSTHNLRHGQLPFGLVRFRRSLTTKARVVIGSMFGFVARLHVVG